MQLLTICKLADLKVNASLGDASDIGFRLACIVVPMAVGIATQYSNQSSWKYHVVDCFLIELKRTRTVKRKVINIKNFNLQKLLILPTKYTFVDTLLKTYPVL